MRRELYRAREEVFWKEYEVMTDESSDLDEKSVEWVLAICKDNFSGDGSAPGLVGDGCGSLVDSLSSRVSSTVESSSSTSSSGDCSSTEQGVGDKPVNKGSTRGASDVVKNSEGEHEESLERRTRRSSYAVSETSNSNQTTDSIAGDEKESQSTENSDNEPASRKRTRVKSESSCEDSLMIHKRFLRSSVTEVTEATLEQASEHAQVRKARRRTSRHLSFPNVGGKTNEESFTEIEASADGSQSIDAVSCETCSQAPQSTTNSETGGENQTSEKPEVDEESRKENNPHREDNVVNSERTENNSMRVAAKRKRSKSTTSVDDNIASKQARITDFLRRKSSNRKELMLTKSLGSRGNKKSCDSDESDEGKSGPYVENLKHSTSTRSFSNGRETSNRYVCPQCKLQHDKLSKCAPQSREGSHTAECDDNWNRRELRLRSFQSPKPRTRCSHVVSPKPHCCSSLMSKFCHATVT